MKKKRDPSAPLTMADEIKMIKVYIPPRRIFEELGATGYENHLMREVRSKIISYIRTVFGAAHISIFTENAPCEVSLHESDLCVLIGDTQGMKTGWAYHLMAFTDSGIWFVLHDFIKNG